VAGYQYDGLKRRTVKQTYSDGVLTETRHYYYSQAWQVLEVRIGSSTSAERQVVWGLRYIDDLVLRDRDTTGNGTLKERLYGMQDPNWNVIALSDITGTVQERYAYSAYGEGTVLTPGFVVRMASIYDWEVRYAGYRWEGETGLYQVRNRILHSLVGWGQRDPTAIHGLQPHDKKTSTTPKTGINLYVYVWGNPLGGTDPSGAFGIFYTGFGGVGTNIELLYNDYREEKELEKVWVGNSLFTGRTVSRVLALSNCEPDCPIDIFGYSRGGVVAILLAHKFNTSGVKVRFLGVIDPIAPFGLTEPAGKFHGGLVWTDLGMVTALGFGFTALGFGFAWYSNLSTLSIPPNVQYLYYAQRDGSKDLWATGWGPLPDPDLSQVANFKRDYFPLSHIAMGSNANVRQALRNYAVSHGVPIR
jgi:RHS repeat-associated protein